MPTYLRTQHKNMYNIYSLRFLTILWRRCSNYSFSCPLVSVFFLVSFLSEYHQQSPTSSTVYIAFLESLKLFMGSPSWAVNDEPFYMDFWLFHAQQPQQPIHLNLESKPFKWWFRQSFRTLSFQINNQFEFEKCQTIKKHTKYCSIRKHFLLFF